MAALKIVASKNLIYFGIKFKDDALSSFINENDDKMKAKFWEN